MKKFIILFLIAFMSINVFSKEKTNKTITNGIETVYDDTKGSITEVYTDAKSAVTTIYGDIKDATSGIYPDVKNAITEIARGLGVGAEYVWTVLVKQYVVLGIAELLKFILFLTILIIGIVLTIKVVNNSKEINWKIIPSVILTIIGLSLITSIDYITILQGLINPDFGAINYILEFIKSL
jgi:hypothetical protein